MSFTNMLREQESRTFEHKRMNGWVVNNDDSQHPDGQKLQRLQVRLPNLHDDIEDQHLPWFTPGAQSAYSGSADIGDHGPIPPIGTKVWITFLDDSQYHGHYVAGVATTDNQIPEFVQSQGGSGSSSSPSSSSSSSQSNGNDGDDNSTAGDQGSTQPGPTVYSSLNSKYSDDYPHAHGNIDHSGNFVGYSTKTDFRENYHVSGTSHATDGKGNTQVVVNGNADRQDNPNAKSLLPEGFSAAVFGNGVIYLSKELTLSVKGNATIAASGDVVVSSAKNATVKAGESATVSAQQKLTLVAGQKIQLAAPIILSSVEIQVGGGGNPESPEQVKDQSAPKVRSRPNPTIPQNDENY